MASPAADKGPAFAFWQRCEDERTARGWFKKELATRAKIARSTYDDLARTKPEPQTVLSLATVLGIDPTEARSLAGLRPAGATPEAPGGVRAAIEASDAYTPEQKAMLLQVIKTIEEANANRSLDR